MLLISIVTSMGMLSVVGAIVVVLVATLVYFPSAMFIWPKAPRRELPA